MLSKRVYVDHLREVPLFIGYSRKDLEKVAAAGDHVTVTDGRVLFVEDDHGEEAFVVLTGEVRVKRKGKVVATLGPGSIVGELALLDKGPRTAGAVCIGDCDLLILSRARFKALADQVPSLNHKLLATLAGRLRDLDTRSYG